MNWQDEATCKGMDTNPFFPPDHHETPKDILIREAEAKAICAVCPVKNECFEAAMEHRETEGIWGGTSKQERDQMRKWRRQAASG